MHMPEMDGIETTKALRFLQTGKDRRPIIMLTADATVDAINACESADIDAFLTKPVESEKLLTTITNLSPKRSERKKSRIRTHRQTLNHESLDKLATLNKNPDFIKDLIAGFIADTKLLISDIETAMHAENYIAIQNHAHAIKGSAHNIGAISLALCASEIFSHSQEGNLLSIPALFSELTQEYETACSALNNYLEKHESAAL
jgi:two-component system sensor histidine kinase RpfC